MDHFPPLPFLAGRNPYVNRNSLVILSEKFDSDMFRLKAISPPKMSGRSVDGIYEASISVVKVDSLD
jgi:hypothetical protein